ncbi:MAG: polysaccharide biosynthesis protein [Clostridia bacterium]|nr:polysaccharide biosynthesis protein [Clostridia bacterium]
MLILVKPRNKSQSLFSGAMVLLVATVIVHIVGILYKIPLTAFIGTVGRGYFNTAYEIYTPIYAISMAGLPVAVSRMVAERMATGRYREVRVIFKIVKKLFILTGFIGTAILFIMAYPYTHWEIFIDSPNAMPSILAIAPSVFFCCLMSTYRGYYEGMRNMIPTAISQVIEAIGKLFFGLVFAKIVMKIGENQYALGDAVFGTIVNNHDEALSAIYPYTAAAAIGGVTVGTIFALLFVMIRHKAIGDGITRENLVNSPRPAPSKDLAKMLISIAIPVVASSLILNITNIIDSWTIQNRLADVIQNNLAYIKDVYAQPLLESRTLDSDIKNYLYGSYGTALDFKNLLPTITMTLGVSSIPALSSAWAIKDRRKIYRTVNSVLRASLLIALPTGICMAILAKPILTFMYIGTRAESSIGITAYIVSVYGFAAAVMALSTPITNMLQAIGRADVPVKSLVMGAIVKIVSNYILVGNPEFNIYGAPIGTILCYTIIVANNLFFLIKETKIKINISSVLLKPLFCASLAGLSAWSSYGLLDMTFTFGDASGRLNSSALALLISSIISVFVYLVSLFLVNAISKYDILMLPKGEKIAKRLEKYGLIG